MEHFPLHADQRNRRDPAFNLTEFAPARFILHKISQAAGSVVTHDRGQPENGFFCRVEIVFCHRLSL